MTIQLTKENPTINLSKVASTLSKIRAGLGWTTKSDLDVSIFGLSSASGAPKLLAESWLVYFGNKISPANAIIHSGDNRTGEGAGDDETILVNLQALPAEIDEVSIIVTIYEAAKNGQHFGDVKDAYINIYDDLTGAVLAQYKLTENFTTETAVQVGSFFRDNGEWVFQAVGAGYNKELGDFVAIYN